MFDLVRLLTSLTIVVIALGIAMPLSPYMLGTLMPPVQDFRILAAESLPDGQVRLTATVQKRWCVFQGLSFTWYDGAGDAWRVGYAPSDQPANTDTNRQPGRHVLGPWLIAASPAPDPERLVIDVRHRCGVVPVITRLASIRP